MKERKMYVVMAYRIERRRRISKRGKMTFGFFLERRRRTV